MSKIRQSGFEPLGTTGADIRTWTQDYPAQYLIPAHYHDRDQLVHASRGVMTVGTGAAPWVVAPRRAVWVPAGVSHDIATSGAVEMRTLYLRRGLVAGLSLCVVNVTPLLEELILEACRIGDLRKRVKRERHVVDVIVDQLRAIRMVPLQLPSPRDPRALKLAHAILAYPEPGPLEEFCSYAGASRRTMERLFRSETGMGLGRWRQQARLMHGMRLLAGGAKVSHAALEAGYTTPSAFIAMFRKALGMTPTECFRSTPQSS
ncbi:MAG TPA: helix-turn-helix transcriptional regulator [Candidatus Acidoferrum sp.]|nr:helix-turn-helix transcriptional regulator [Candidatus Acidoferrum sp.]